VSAAVATPRAGESSAAKDWLRALQLTSSIARDSHRLLSTVMAENATACPDAPALLSAGESLTFAEFVQRSNQYARWFLQSGLKKGDVVGLLMENCPEYFALWVGITSVGGVVALLNTNLVGASLAHCINVVAPRHLIVSTQLAGAVAEAEAGLSVAPRIWAHGDAGSRFPRIDTDVHQQPVSAPAAADRPAVTVEDRALFIFTSGTTGLPKAAAVSHARILQWTQWFAGLMGIRPSDRMYCCLPMYHSIGGVLVPGAALAAGGSVVIRQGFSASRFWDDVVRWDCTLFQYIGEVCRYLLHAPPSASDRAHRIRIACGNGMPPDVWQKFTERFAIPRILEFYGSTEGGVSLFNVEGERGSIGRVPAYLRHRFSPVLIRLDAESGAPIRDENGFCIRAAANEPGEALGRISHDPSAIGSRFEGYTDSAASERKILRDVFAAGDCWVRTGDLMRQDERGFFYFVDRIGDTFRWKSENVATTEVSEAMCEFPGVRQAIVYGVAVPGCEGRAGMAAIVADHDIDLSALRAYLSGRLPSYARPVFLRMRQELEVTGTFKYSRTDLARQGFDPSATSDILCFNDPESASFLRLDTTLFDRICAGHIRL
jgi:fatty-acyl-CoA synthase